MKKQYAKLNKALIAESKKYEKKARAEWEAANTNNKEPQVKYYVDLDCQMGEPSPNTVMFPTQIAAERSLFNMMEAQAMKQASRPTDTWGQVIEIDDAGMKGIAAHHYFSPVIP